MRRMPGREDGGPAALEEKEADEAAAAAAAVEEKLPGIGEKLPGARWPRGGGCAMSERGRDAGRPGAEGVKRDVSEGEWTSGQAGYTTVREWSWRRRAWGCNDDRRGREAGVRGWRWTGSRGSEPAPGGFEVSRLSRDEMVQGVACCRATVSRQQAVACQAGREHGSDVHALATGQSLSLSLSLLRTTPALPQPHLHVQLLHLDLTTASHLHLHLHLHAMRSHFNIDLDLDLDLDQTRPKQQHHSIPHQQPTT